MEDLKPIYGGPTLLEALWAEMDRLMEGLMTGQGAEGDRYRAEELAWVLAIVSNPYDPSVDRIRAETMDRWNAEQEFQRQQEEALNPDEQEDLASEMRSQKQQDEADQDDMMTRPEGADQ